MIPTNLHELRNRMPGCILLFRQGDFLEAYGEDARILKDEGLASEAYVLDGEFVAVLGPFHQREYPIARILHKGHRVALCEEITEMPRGWGKKPERIVTP